jgi:hypothetical protein
LRDFEANPSVRGRQLLVGGRGRTQKKPPLKGARLRFGVTVRNGDCALLILILGVGAVNGRRGGLQATGANGLGQARAARMRIEKGLIQITGDQVYPNVIFAHSGPGGFVLGGGWSDKRHHLDLDCPFGRRRWFHRQLSMECVGHSSPRFSLGFLRWALCGSWAV